MTHKQRATFLATCHQGRKRNPYSSTKHMITYSRGVHSTRRQAKLSFKPAAHFGAFLEDTEEPETAKVQTNIKRCFKCGALATYESTYASFRKRYFALNTQLVAQKYFRKEKSMGTNTRGFASMDPAKAHEVQSKGGKAAQASGKAYRFTSEAASRAGKAAAQARQRMILTVTCSVCEQKLTAQELKHHVC